MKVTIAIFRIVSYEPMTTEPVVKRSFDNMLEAKRWKCKLLHSVGLVDDYCTITTTNP